MSDEIIIPLGVDAIITAICADYPRRSSVILCKSAPYNVIMEYRFLNYRIMNAAVEIAGSRDALLFIYDIGSNVGYTSSQLYTLSESVYKNRKNLVKENIAKRLSLI